MGFLIIVFILIVIFTAVSIKTDGDHGTAGMLLLILIFSIMVVGIIDVHCEANAESASLQETHNILQYQIDNSPYNKELYDEMHEYNVKVIRGRVLKKNFWVGSFYADIYDDLELVKLPGF